VDVRVWLTSLDARAAGALSSARLARRVWGVSATLGGALLAAGGIEFLRALGPRHDVSWTVGIKGLAAAAVGGVVYRIGLEAGRRSGILR